ncbi:MAG: LysR substrate-binding domain-containing protein [Pseudomonadota bacterium]
MPAPLPFTSLRAFEAVARRGSFSEAASELSVSQSAVSQQVKSLEEWLGATLLVRSARGARPTPEGQALADAVAAGFGGVAQECRRLRESVGAKASVTVSALPGFAFIWLFPRLLNFDLAHPNTPISVTTDIGDRGLIEGVADVGIRYGDGAHPGFIVEPLISETVFPVCAPELLRGAAPLAEVSDLADHTMLMDAFSPLTKTPPTWEFWAKVCGVTLPTPARTRSFGQSNLVVQAALSGLGVALGRTPLVNAALEEGRLVRPFAQEARSLAQYWLVYKPEVRRIERITLFLDWIKAEAEATAAPPPFTPRLHRT